MRRKPFTLRSCHVPIVSDKKSPPNLQEECGWLSCGRLCVSVPATSRQDTAVQVLEQLRAELHGERIPAHLGASLPIVAVSSDETESVSMCGVCCVSCMFAGIVAGGDWNAKVHEATFQTCTNAEPATAPGGWQVAKQCKAKDKMPG